MVESAEETRNRLVSPLEAAGRGKKTPLVMLSLRSTVTSASSGRFFLSPTPHLSPSPFPLPFPPTLSTDRDPDRAAAGVPPRRCRRSPSSPEPRSLPSPKSYPLPHWSRRTSPAAAAASIVGPPPRDAARSLAGGGAGSASLGRCALARCRCRRIRLPALCGGGWAARWAAARSPAATAAGSGSLRCAAGDGLRGAPPTGRRRRWGGRFFLFF